MPGPVSDAANNEIAAVLLAAGESRRFDGGDKMLAEIDGLPLVAWTARGIPRDIVGTVVAVTRPADFGRRAALDGLGVVHALSAEADAGQGRSIATGIGALPAACRGAFVVPGDMPGLRPALFRKLVAEFFAREGNGIVFPTIAGQLRPPVLWPRDMFPMLAALEGDAGGKAIVERNRFRSRGLPIEPRDAVMLDDVDTSEDLACIKEWLGGAGG